ncbi:MAG TPA: universal stress protein [Streptosporangiaceae bacterium]|nr:universal stress protein [Streptosporangiaceae bacterium]
MPGIIVGVDGSGHSRRALEWAIREASVRHAPLTVISVHPALMSYWGAVTYPEGKLDHEQALREVQAVVDKAASGLEGPVPEISVQVTPGSPATELINAAKDADLLVVGSRGAGGFTRLMLGSVSTQVTQHATCPVVVIPEQG